METFPRVFCFSKSRINENGGKHGTRNEHHKRNKMTPNGFAAGPVLTETKFPRFYLKQGSSTPSNLMGRIKTMWEPCVK